LGVSIKPLSIKKNQFEAACLTSVGVIEFKDATATFSAKYLINFNDLQGGLFKLH